MDKFCNQTKMVWLVLCITGILLFACMAIFALYTVFNHTFLFIFGICMIIVGKLLQIAEDYDSPFITRKKE